MARALRVISVQRGEDPCDYVLMSFGGAGGLHVCALAEALGMRRALVPVNAGVLSALGMLVAPPSRQLSHTLTGALSGFAKADIERQLQALAAAGRAELANEGVAPGDVVAQFSLDLRYPGQSHTLNLAWAGATATAAAFHDLHEQRYGHRMDLPVELVNVRCGLQGEPAHIHMPPVEENMPTPRMAAVAGCAAPVPVWDRATLGAGQLLNGPALITETVASTWLPPSWSCEVDGTGNLLLARE